MTKEELGQLIDLRKEIKELDEKIERLKKQRVGNVSDRVHASMQEFPYCYTTVTITGVDQKESKKRRAVITENEMLLLKRRQQAVDAEYRISKFIANIEDSKMRRIISLRYEEGHSWTEVADIMNYDRTYPSKAVTKYLKEHGEKKGKTGNRK